MTAVATTIEFQRKRKTSSEESGGVALLMSVRRKGQFKAEQPPLDPKRSLRKQLNKSTASSRQSPQSQSVAIAGQITSEKPSHDNSPPATAANASMIQVEQIPEAQKKKSC